MNKDEATIRCQRASRAQHHLMDARARLVDLGLRSLVLRVDQLLKELEPIREDAWNASGLEPNTHPGALDRGPRAG